MEPSTIDLKRKFDDTNDDDHPRPHPSSANKPSIPSDYIPTPVTTNTTAKPPSTTAATEAHPSNQDTMVNIKRLPKRRMALMIGYSGQGYHGSQINLGMKTIEGEVFNALVRAGCITNDNSTHPNKVGLQRSARTDANVHACCNLISLKLILHPSSIDQDFHHHPSSEGLQPKPENSIKPLNELESIHSSLIQHSKYFRLIKHINQFLPPQIRVWNMVKVQNSFNARSFCDSRVYEYSLPTWLFLPPKPGSYLYDRLNKLPINVDPNDDHQPKTWSEAYEHEARDAEGTWWKDHRDLIDQDFKTIQAEKKKSYRISNRMIERIESILERFKGTHNFHNFTVGKSFRERNSTRIMKELRVSDPFLIDVPPNPSFSSDPPTSTEWISITFHGQSFMLHQIRKMVGLIVLMCRTATPVKLIDELYGPKKIRIPKAPGVGLMLRKLHFYGYNKKISQVNQLELKKRNERKSKSCSSNPQELGVQNSTQTLQVNTDDKEVGEVGVKEGKEEDGMIWDFIDCDELNELFDRFKTEVLFKSILPHQPPTDSSTVGSSPPPQTIGQVESNLKFEVKSSEELKEEGVESGLNENDPDRFEDPFAVWINYLDVYTGPDLDFLNPNGVIPNPT